MGASGAARGSGWQAVPWLPSTRAALDIDVPGPSTAAHLNSVPALSTKQCLPSWAAELLPERRGTRPMPGWWYGRPALPPAQMPRCCHGIAPMSLDIFPCSRGTRAPAISPCAVPLVRGHEALRTAGTTKCLPTQG